MTNRPPFIVNWNDHVGEDNSHYPGSDELLSFGANISELAGFTRLGIWVDVLKPGRRSSWPHAHSKQEEFIYVASGTPEVFVDGHVHALMPGQSVVFPPGTGEAHCFINNSDTDAVLVVVGEKVEGDSVHYPLHPERNKQAAEKGTHWSDAPIRDLGPHDGKPDALKNC